MSTAQIQALAKFSPCDVCGVASKLITDIGCATQAEDSGLWLPRRPQYVVTATAANPELFNGPTSGPIIAPASTVLFAPKSGPTTGFPDGNIPKDKHYVDLTERDTIVVVSQPQGQQNAVLGGIMALRMKVCGAVGVVVDGRVRDLEEYEKLGEFKVRKYPFLLIQVFGKATSTVGAGGESKPHAVQVPITVNGVDISPGDIIFACPREGVVAIPKNLLEQVLELAPKSVAADDKVKEAVAQGMSVKEAFEKFR